MSAMRAIKITEFGGPEVLVLATSPSPESPDGTVLIDVAAAGINYADTHQADNSYLAPRELPLVPGGEVVGTTPDGRRVVALLAGRRLRRAGLARPQLTCDVPDGITDGAGAGARAAGHDRLAPAAHLRAAARGRERRRARRGRRRRHARRAARQALGRRPRHRAASSADKRALAAELGADAAVDRPPRT